MSAGGQRRSPKSPRRRAPLYKRETPLSKIAVRTVCIWGGGGGGRQNAATRRNMRKEERVTVQGPVKKQQPDGMSHGGGVPGPGPGPRGRGLRRFQLYVNSVTG